MLKNEKTRKPRHFCVDSRKIRKSYTSNDNLIIIKGKRLVKVHDLDCDAIRMLQQIFLEIVNALNVSIQERKLM